VYISWEIRLLKRATSYALNGAKVAKMPDAKNLDTMLKRAALAVALTDEGFPVAEASLATMATRGGGPAFQKFGKTPLYRWGDALDWARSRLSRRVRTTAELDLNEVKWLAPRDNGRIA